MPWNLGALSSFIGVLQPERDRRAVGLVGMDLDGDRVDLVRVEARGHCQRGDAVVGAVAVEPWRPAFSRLWPSTVTITCPPSGPSRS